MNECYLSSGALQPASRLHQAYLDVEPADTAHFLNVVRAINISTYRLSYERSKTNRLRIGAIGPEIAQIIPEAVELVPKRILPPAEKGGEPVILHNVPVVHENTLFMFGVGATQELIRKVDLLSTRLTDQINNVTALFGEAARLEHLLSQSSNEEAELRMEASRAEARKLQSQLEIEIQRAENEKNYLDAQREEEVLQIKRNEEMTLSRLALEEERARARDEEEMRLKFEANRRIEQSRNEAAEALSIMQYERDIALQKATEEMRTLTAKKIAEAKAQAERANEDVHLRKLKAEAEQNRKRNVAAINAIVGHIASSLHSASKNPKQVVTFICYFTFLATAVYTARELARLCRAIIESTVGKPKLIRETTRKSYPQEMISSIIDWCKTYYYDKVGDVDVEEVFEDVALNEELKNRVLSIASSASKVRKNDAPHRHILFFGKPGTGKTMVARKLAKSIGMDYALMSGGDVGPLGADAVTQIHNLFRWAKFSKKGVLLFIDEAEAFLGDRSKNTMSENAHNALNALLFHTGTEKKDFMLVLATNRAEDLDAAILDRCDESLLFPLPNQSCRFQLVEHYFGKFVRAMEARHNDKENDSLLTKLKNIWSPADTFHVTIQASVMDKGQTKWVVEATEGFSGREISKLMIALSGAIYASSDGTLTPAIVNSIVSKKVKEHKVKLEMTCGVAQKNQTKKDPLRQGMYMKRECTLFGEDLSFSSDSDNSSEQERKIDRSPHDKNAKEFNGCTVTENDKNIVENCKNVNKVSEQIASCNDTNDGLSYDENSHDYKGGDDESISSNISDLSCASSEISKEHNKEDEGDIRRVSPPTPPQPTPGQTPKCTCKLM